MRKGYRFRRGIAAALTVMTTLAQVQVPAFAETNRTGAGGDIGVNPQIHYQTLEGWGTSLCWWGNIIGAAGDRDYNNNGRPDREEIAELAFSPEYLNLNIVRYNVGGGDKPDSTIKRVEGRVPGWSRDMFGAEDGSGEFLGEGFYEKQAEAMNDAGQIWMLEQANRWRQDEGDIINEVFSNSPPYYMTKSGSSTGGNDRSAWDKENLKEECYDDFALYMARATKWLDQNLRTKFGTGVDYVEPLNEPDTNYWLNGSTKQEGCIFYPGASQIKAYQAVKEALRQEGLADVKLTGTDETSLDKAIWSFGQLDTQTRADLDVISAHTYGGNDAERARLRDIAASYDKGLWMSEVTKGGGNTHNEWSHGDMGQCQADHQSMGIMSDLKKMQASAWIAWLVADSEYECIQTNQNWGLLHYVFEEDGPVRDYHTNLFDGNGNVKAGVPGAGYWAVTKQFYTMMQYSKYLKAGYTMIDIGDDDMCAAVSPDRKELVIVAQYFGNGSRNTSIDLSRFPNATDVKLYRTTSSGDDNCSEKDASLSGGMLNVSLPEWSVSTYVITGDGNPLYEESGYKTIVSSNVEATEDTRMTGASDYNKFTYTGSWKDGWEWGAQEKYTTEKEASATFKFSGVQAALYGKKSENGAELLIQIDGGDAVPVSAYASNETRRSHLYTTPVLAEGEHEVRISMAEDQTAESPEIVLEYAEIIRGEVKAADPGYTKEALEANDYVLYTVNCGTPDPSVVPNSNNERMGLLQSKVDQEYGADEETGRMWGCDPANEYSMAVKHGDDATDLGNSFIYMSDSVTFDKYKSGLSYTFELPEEPIEGISADTYEVTLEFKHFWDDRWVNIALEGRTVATDIGLQYDSWVRQTFTTTVTDGQLNVRVQSPRRNGSKQDPILNFIKVRALPDKEPDIITYDSFTGVAGEMMYDTEGKPIQAHGGQIQQLTVDGETRWYWIGEDKTNDYRPVGGIHVYSSDDLYNWTDEGVVLQTMEDPAQFKEDPYFADLYGDYDEEKQAEIFVDLDRNNCVMERPKMIYNEEYDHYVIWFHADGRTPYSDADYGKAKAGIAVSDSPTGPFKLLGSYKLNYHDDPNADHGYDGWDGRGSVRDMNLFVDDDKTAYVIYSSEGNRTTFISRLNDSYTDLEVPRDEAVEGEHFTRNFIGWSREAPAMFQYRDKYYIINSGCTGWSPNPAQYMMANHPMGPWTAMGDPCNGWDSDTTFSTQSTCVFPVDAENGAYIYMGDRWNAGYLRDSRYIWLPVEFQDDGRIVLNRYENWTLEDLEGKGLASITSEIPEQFGSLAELKAALPDTIDVSVGGTEMQDVPVQWDDIDAENPYLGEYRVKGWLTEQNRSIAHTATILDEGMQYFFDCNQETSGYFELLKETARGLRNTEPDQSYTEENHAGYTGEVDTDFGEFNGRDLYGSGWWAKKDKAIEYAFDLEPGNYKVATGYQGWWSIARDMKVSAVAKGTDGSERVLAAKEFTLDSWESGTTQALDITVPENGEDLVTVLVRVEKVREEDSILSFIGISSNEAVTETSRIEITALPDKVKYAIGEELDLTGLEVTLYMDGEPERVLEKEEYEVGEMDSSKAGTKNIEVTCELEGKTYKASFRVLVSETAEPSIKIVKKPGRLIYRQGEEPDLDGMVVRGRNIGGEEVLELMEGDYDVKYDFSEAGNTDVTVVYTVLEEADAEETDAEEADVLDDENAVGLQLKDSFEVLVLEEEARVYAESLKIRKPPYRTVYMVDEAFEMDGMIVEKTMRGDGVRYTQEVPLENLEWDVEEFSKAGTKKVVMTYREEGEDGETELSDTLSVTVTKKDSVMAEGLLEAARRKLEEALSFGEYVTEEEEAEALSEAIEKAREGVNAYGGEPVSQKAFSVLKKLEDTILEANPRITSSVQADEEFGAVQADGLALSADVASRESQIMKLQLVKSEEEAPSDITRDADAYMALEITLHQDGEELQPKLPLKITMDIPKGMTKNNLVIYHLHNGEWKTIYPVIRGNQMSFIVSDLSLFVAANTKEENKTPVSGGGSRGSRSGRGGQSSKGGPGYTTPGTWKQDLIGWWYQKTDGSYVRASWALINGLWYYFNDSGYMVTGWVLDDGRWYYLKEDGSMAVNMTTPDGYQVDNNGVFVK